MSRIAYFDCFSGASGDMILGALLDAGLPLKELRGALGSLTLGDISIKVDRVDRSGIGATNFRVVTTGSARSEDERETHSHDHGGSHGHHHHRGLSEICTMVDGSALSGTAKDRAKELFTRLATVEAEIHQQPVEEIHLHEVGAVDSIIDIAGVVFGLEWLDVDTIVASPLNVGSGTVRCAHGIMPVPAPATARLVTGVPIYSSGVQAELLTPTGALLVSDYVNRYGPMPPMQIDKLGYGAGDRELIGTPNVLRIVVGDDAASSALQRVVVLESEVDDMNPQIFGILMDQLYAKGALDVFYAPIHMKKGRPGILISVVALPEHRDVLSGVLFRETTTLGVRFSEVDREQLPREIRSVDTKLGPIRFKVASREGQIVNTSAEFEDCATLAKQHGLSVKEVQAIAMKAYLDS